MKTLVLKFKDSFKNHMKYHKNGNIFFSIVSKLAVFSPVSTKQVYQNKALTSSLCYGT